MKKSLFTFTFFILVLNVHAQLRLEVEGNSRFAGNLEIFSPLDSHSVHVGVGAGSSATSNSNDNVFMGYQAGNQNTVGDWNVYIGFKAGKSQVENWCNTFVGPSAGELNTGGTNNVFIGAAAGKDNITGWGNVFMGRDAGLNNQGIGNTFVGHEAGRVFSSGNDNVFYGNKAGQLLTSGSQNTALGYQTSYLNNNLTNTIVVGTNATINASNKIRLGNANISVAEVQVNWSVTSDSRYKKNVKKTANGLNFILGLNPVSYQYDLEKVVRETQQKKAEALSLQARHEKSPFPIVEDKEGDEKRLREELETAKEQSKVIYYGFLAQEVEAAAQQFGYEDFSGIVKPEINGGTYALRYAEFVVPLVEAVQQQQKIIDEKEARILALEKEVSEMKAVLSQLVSQINKE